MRASPSESSRSSSLSSLLMAPEQIPVVDLRTLSQSDLQTLSVSSPNHSGAAAAVLPKIDKSVFNESAGSRKQTYSRLRLAPISSSKRNSSNPSSNDPYKELDASNRENQLIVSHLRKLFAKEDSSFSLPAAPLSLSDVQGSQTLVLYKKEEESSIVLPPAPDRDKEILNSNGEAIDLAQLARKVDPYIEEIQKRTEGLKSEGELLGFLGGLEGEWMSRRQRRRFVDASGFGNHLPKGWKLLLGLKRKEGMAWVNCRRFVSPNGHHFETCKQVSSYIQSLLGIIIPNDITPVSAKTESSSFGANTPSLLPVTNNETKSDNNSTQQECTKCHLNFTEKSLYLQHQLSFHQKSRKRRRNNEQNDDIIMRDGKYICQYCDKSFDERSRYFGHVGAHVRYQGVGIGNPRNVVGTPKNGEMWSGENPRNGSSSLAENPKKDEELVFENSMSDKSSLNGNPKTGETSKVGNLRNEITPLVENPKNGEKSLVERNEISPLVENPKNGEKPLVENPRNEITPMVENPKSSEKPLVENPRNEITPMVENPKSSEKPLVESPRNEKIPLIANPRNDKAPLIENPKNSEKPLVESPRNEKIPLIANPKNDNAPLIENPKNVEMPLVENPKNGETNAIEVSLSSENQNSESEASLLTQSPETAKAPEIQIPTFIQNPKNAKAPEIQIPPFIQNPKSDNDNDKPKIAEIEISPLFEIQTLPSVQNPINGDIPFEKDNEGNNNITSSIHEEAIHDQMDNNSNNNNNICELKESEEFYEMNEDEYPAVTYPQMVSQIFSPDDLYDENEMSNNNNNDNNNSEELDKCPEMETFDLNNFDIVSNSNNSNNATNICKASSEETSFMDEGNELNELNEINESQLPSRPITFSELLANANAHANANLDLNNNIISDQNNTNTTTTTTTTTNNNNHNNTNNNNRTITNNTSENHQHLMDTSITEFQWTPPLTNPNLVVPLDASISELKPNYSSIGELKPADDYSSCFPSSMNGFDMNMEWVKPGSGLGIETRYENNNPQPGMSGGAGRNFMEMMTMQDGGLDESFTSMVNSAAGSSSGVPMPNVIMPNKLNNIGYQHRQYVSNAPMPSFGAMHMPHNNNNNHSNNNNIPQQAMLFGFPPQMVNPALQLGWGMPMPAQQHQQASVCVSVCVWCAREFRHEAGSLTQQNQTDSLGFICPSCKDRFSAGHGHLGL